MTISTRFLLVKTLVDIATFSLWRGCRLGPLVSQFHQRKVEVAAQRLGQGSISAIRRDQKLVNDGVRDQRRVFGLFGYSHRLWVLHVSPSTPASHLHEALSRRDHFALGSDEVFLETLDVGRKYRLSRLVAREIKGSAQLELRDIEIRLGPPGSAVIRS